MKYINKISYIILHYQVLNDTIECVDSILKLDKGDIEQKIIIVDNSSPNKSGEVIKQKYIGLPNIIVILASCNLGFAKGNNLGCKFAIDNFKPDFLVVLNNDIIIKQRDFQHHIFELHNKFRFHVLGPDIISLVDNLHQSPIDFAINSKKAILKESLLLSFLLFLSFLNLDQKFMLYRNRKNINFSKIERNFDFKENIKIHGAAIIFSKSYYDIFPEIFFNKTFMYMEEDILYHRIKQKCMKVIYSNDIVVFHKEDSATNFAFKKEASKRRFIYKNTIKSLYEYFKAYNDL